jgi:geranylgeranyl diphosphate synthase type II
MDAGLATAAARQAQVDAVLARLFSLARKRAEPLGSAYVELWDRIEASTTGGKRFRPRMVFAAYSALGGDDFDAAAYVGAAFELLHTSPAGVHRTSPEPSATARSPREPTRPSPNTTG